MKDKAWWREEVNLSKCSERGRELLPPVQLPPGPAQHPLGKALDPEPDQIELEDAWWILEYES